MNPMTPRIENRDGKLFIHTDKTVATGVSSSVTIKEEIKLPSLRELADALGIVPTREEIYGEAYEVSLSPEYFEEGANWILSRLGLSNKEEPKSDEFKDHPIIQTALKEFADEVKKSEPDEMAGLKLLKEGDVLWRGDLQRWKGSKSAKMYEIYGPWIGERLTTDFMHGKEFFRRISDTPTDQQYAAAAEVISEPKYLYQCSACGARYSDPDHLGMPWVCECGGVIGEATAAPISANSRLIEQAINWSSTEGSNAPSTFNPDDGRNLAPAWIGAARSIYALRDPWSDETANIIQAACEKHAENIETQYRQLLDSLGERNAIYARLIQERDTLAKSFQTANEEASRLRKELDGMRSEAVTRNDQVGRCVRQITEEVQRADKATARIAELEAKLENAVHTEDCLNDIIGSARVRLAELESMPSGRTVHDAGSSAPSSWRRSQPS